MTRSSSRGIKPVVEYRKANHHYFVVYDELSQELAPAFKHKTTAYEVALAAYYGVPFFTMIPRVPYRTEYPRPNTLMPRQHPLEVPLRIC